MAMEMSVGGVGGGGGGSGEGGVVVAAVRGSHSGGTVAAAAAAVRGGERPGRRCQAVAGAHAVAAPSVGEPVCRHNTPIQVQSAAGATAALEATHHTPASGSLPHTAVATLVSQPHSQL